MKNYEIHIEHESDGWWHWQLFVDGSRYSRYSGWKMTRWGAERAARRQIRADKEGAKIIKVTI